MDGKEEGVEKVTKTIEMTDEEFAKFSEWSEISRRRQLAKQIIGRIPNKFRPNSIYEWLITEVPSSVIVVIAEYYHGSVNTQPNNQILGEIDAALDEELQAVDEMIDEFYDNANVVPTAPTKKKFNPLGGWLVEPAAPNTTNTTTWFPEEAGNNPLNQSTETTND